MGGTSRNQGMPMHAEPRLATSPSRRRTPIPLPAPLASSPPMPHASSIVALPRLRWAARCDDTQFDDGVVTSHAHNEPELVFCTKGRIRIVVDGMALEGGPGDLIILPATSPHALESDEAWENICVLYAKDTLLDTQPRTIGVGEDHICRRWLDDLCRLYDSRPQTPGPAADALLLTVITEVVEMERRKRASQALHPRLDAAVKYLRERPARTVRSAELASATRTSYSHLGALFRERFGCGPLDYHRMKRMEQAQNLLLDPYLSVGEVARQVGFDDLSYFVRVFRKTVGVSPNRWRKSSAQAFDPHRGTKR